MSLSLIVARPASILPSKVLMLTKNMPRSTRPWQLVLLVACLRTPAAAYIPTVPARLPPRGRQAVKALAPDPAPPATPRATGGHAGGLWPRGDALDRRIAALAGPAVLTLLIRPVVGIIDSVWVGRLQSSLALAGVAAARQVFSSAFWLTSSLPAVVAPRVARAASVGDARAVEDEVGAAAALAAGVGLAASALLFLAPQAALDLALPRGVPARAMAAPYVRFRALGFASALFGSVGQAAHRGRLDPATPLRVALAAQLLHVLLFPALVLGAGMGVAGAGAATAAAELFSGAAYAYLLRRQGVLRLRRGTLRWASLRPLLSGGAAFQLRALALSATFLAVRSCRVVYPESQGCWTCATPRVCP